MATQAVSQTNGTSASFTQATSNSSVNKDQFLKLLTYQLKAQNPLKPYDNQEFASQLAQFSQLEQLTDIRNFLSEQVKSNQLLTQTIANSALPGMLGKSAKADLNKLTFDGTNPVNIIYAIPQQATNGEIRITDSSGKLVSQFSISPTDLSKGEHKITWDGKDSNSNNMPSGNYNITARFTDNKGVVINSNLYIQGKIEAVRFKTEGTVLIINGQEVQLDKVYDISNN